MTSSSVARIFATMFIWAAVTILGASTLINSANLGGAPVIILMIILLGVAASLTRFFWNMTDERDQAEKGKRTSRVARLVDDLSDEELDELRVRLMSSTDGEMVSVDELLNEIDRRAVR